MNNRKDLNFLLQECSFKSLKKVCDEVTNSHKIEIVEKPNLYTVLVPVKDPISGGSFYVGEVLATRCIVRIDEKHMGWAMVYDENYEMANYVAILDAAYGAGFFIEKIDNLLAEGRNNFVLKKRYINQYAHSTKVEFDLM